MDRMALPWTARWRELAAAGSIAAFLLAFAIFVYEWTAPAGAPITPIDARVVGFGVNANSSKRLLVGEPTLTVGFRLADGTVLYRSLPADQASRCRVGQRVRLGTVTSRGGVLRLVTPPDPCNT